MTDRRPIIALQHVTKRYEGRATAALDGVTLDIAPGEFLAVVGSSGCGKTTLLGLINRLIEPTEGTIWVDGQDVRDRDPVTLRRSMGYVFQDVGLFPHLSVQDNVAVTPRLLGWNESRVQERVATMLNLVRLSDAKIAERRTAELSGGQQQRVGIARALAAEPRIVLMDEPFGALDPLTREGLGTDYRRMHDQLGLTTVMITHDMIEAIMLADRIAVLDAGRLIETGAPQALLQNAQHPRVRELMAAPVRQADRLNALMVRGPAAP